jgi:hypothetical protein
MGTIKPQPKVTPAAKTTLVVVAPTPDQPFVDALKALVSKYR